MNSQSVFRRPSPFKKAVLATTALLAVLSATAMRPSPALAAVDPMTVATVASTTADALGLFGRGSDLALTTALQNRELLVRLNSQVMSIGNGVAAILAKIDDLSEQNRQSTRQEIDRSKAQGIINALDTILRSIILEDGLSEIEKHQVISRHMIFQAAIDELIDSPPINVALAISAGAAIDLVFREILQHAPEEQPNPELITRNKNFYKSKLKFMLNPLKEHSIGWWIGFLKSVVEKKYESIISELGGDTDHFIHDLFKSGIGFYTYDEFDFKSVKNFHWFTLIVEERSSNALHREYRKPFPLEEAAYTCWDYSRDLLVKTTKHNLLLISLKNYGPTACINPFGLRTVSEVDKKLMKLAHKLPVNERAKEDIICGQHPLPTKSGGNAKGEIATLGFLQAWKDVEVLCWYGVKPILKKTRRILSELRPRNMKFFWEKLTCTTPLLTLCPPSSVLKKL